MFAIGSAEIILILFTVIFLLLPTALIVCVLYIIFKRQGRIKELESRVAALEKEKAMESRINSLEQRVDEMKK
jgi:cell division protein FtsL